MVKLASESSSQTPGNVISECPSKPTLIQLPVWLAPAIPNEEYHSGVSCLCFVKQNRAVFSSQNEEWVKAGGCDQPGGKSPVHARILCAFQRALSLISLFQMKGWKGRGEVKVLTHPCSLHMSHGSSGTDPKDYGNLRKVFFWVQPSQKWC